MLRVLYGFYKLRWFAGLFMGPQCSERDAWPNLCITPYQYRHIEIKARF